MDAVPSSLMKFHFVMYSSLKYINVTISAPWGLQDFTDIQETGG
jgi:hypothetical protein